MCGITGVVGHSSTHVVEKMTTSIRHRGPDSEGYFHSGEVRMGVRRLSILDPERGDQPLYANGGEMGILFNGEIYNYRELRADLVTHGHQFRTESDTEVVLALFKEYGVAAFAKLHGMFAFAISDGARTFLVRDHFGIKPLHFTYLGSSNTLVFGSEIKAIMQHPDVHLVLDVQSLTELHHFGFVFGNETLFLGITSVAPGTYLEITTNDAHIHVHETSFYEREGAVNAHLDRDTVLDELRELLERATVQHLQGASRFALALSGGLDSSLLASFIPRERHADAVAYTIADNSESPEVVNARLVAQALGYRHEVFVPTYDEYLAQLPRLIFHTERYTTQGVALFLLAQQMKETGKVCLSGEGADEIWYGYERHVHPESFVADLVQKMNRIEASGHTLRTGAVEAIAFLQTSSGAPELAERVGDFLQRGPLVSGHLEILDKGAMASSIEMRVPYLDRAITDFAARLPLHYMLGDEYATTKALLKLLAHKEPRLERAQHRKKMGLRDACANHRARFVEECERLPDAYVRNHAHASFLRARPSASLKHALVLLDTMTHLFVDGLGVSPEPALLREVMADAARA